MGGFDWGMQSRNGTLCWLAMRIIQQLGILDLSSKPKIAWFEYLAGLKVQSTYCDKSRPDLVFAKFFWSKNCWTWTSIQIKKVKTAISSFFYLRQLRIAFNGKIFSRNSTQFWISFRAYHNFSRGPNIQGIWNQLKIKETGITFFNWIALQMG